MSRFSERYEAINADWNDLPRRLLWIVGLIACLFLVLFAFPYVAPFALAALFAWMINPAVTFLTRITGGKKAMRGVFSILFVIFLASLLMLLLMLLSGRVFEEIKTLAIAMPGWITQASTDVINWLEGLDLDWLLLENSLEEIVMRMVTDVTSALTSLATRIATSAARGAWRAVGVLPQGILFIVLTLMGTFYMSTDKERIFTFLRSLLPERHRKRSTLMRASVIHAVLTQIRSALIMLCVTFAELSVGFLLMKMDYAILLALIIALLDALPVVGAGLFLIPMCLYGIVVGNATLAVGAGLLYLTAIVMRQILEPRIIGHQLGLYPLATMMAMYAGLIAMGFLGLLLGPLLLLLCKVALTVDNDQIAEPVAVKPKIRLRRKKPKG